MSTNVEERTAARKEDNEKSFSAWLEKPKTKLMISMIPQAENPDAMRTLLRSCFDCAYGAGEGAVAVMMIKAMLESGPRGNSDPRNRF